MSNASDRQWLNGLPKVELHVHLEGSIPYETLWTLISKYGGDPDVKNEEQLREKLRFRDFPHFIATWIWMSSFLREYDDFTLIAEAVAREFVNQKVLYVEAFFSPRDFARHNLHPQGLATAIRTGLSRAPEVEVALVADLTRNFGPEEGARTLAKVNEVRDQGVIGIGIGGSEHDFPPEPFAPVFETARTMGFRTNAHAGEVAGPESIWGAIRDLKVDRIGHGTRAVEDAELVDFLVERQIPVELNPISNVRTGVVRSLGEHPAREYLRRGMMVCVNTDDPKMFHNTLVDEFTGLIDHLAMSRADVRTMILNGVRSSWLPPARKEMLLRQFQRAPAWGDDEAP